MRLDGVDVTLWSPKTEILHRHMFILDLIRDYNKFVNETMVSYLLSPYKNDETFSALKEILADYKKNILYTVFSAEEKNKYKDKIVSDEEILDRVGKL